MFQKLFRILYCIKSCEHRSNFHNNVRINFKINHVNNANNHSEIAVRGTFENANNKNKETYIELIYLFTERDINRRGHVEFIYSALKNMQLFNVEKDLEVYKKILNVFPKGKFIPTNIFQAEFMHYPKQQQCAIDLLQQMEDKGAIQFFFLNRRYNTTIFQVLCLIMKWKTF